LMYCFLLPLLYLLTIVLYVLLWMTFNTMVKRYQRGNKKQYIKEGHSIQWSKDIKEVIRNSKWCTVSYYLFGIFWPLYWMSFFDVLFLITSFISFDHCIVCPSLIYCFLLGNKKQYIKERHSIQWSKDIKEVIRKSTSKKDIQYNGQKIPKR
jgi:Na+/melibiose symporter-like transporter